MRNVMYIGGKVPRLTRRSVRRLVVFPSESGEPILVEVEDVGLGGETWRGLSPSAVVERAQTSFEDALDKARPMATGLVGKLRAIGDAAGNPRSLKGRSSGRVLEPAEWCDQARR